MTPHFDKPLAYIDTETTGLDPRVHEVIEFACIKVHTQRWSETWCTKIAPSDPESVSEEAAAINGYTPERWKDAPTMQQVGPTIVKMLQECIAVGHHISFDEKMLTYNMERAGVEGSIPRHKIDTCTLAFEHLFPMGLRSASLDSIREFLGWSHANTHTALVDAQDAKRLHELLHRAGHRTRARIRLHRLLHLPV